EETLWQTVRLLEGVSIANPVQVARGYPHELSGGMLQRVMIAMALCSEPELLIADEPTTALDVTIQAQILELMRDLKARMGSSILLITHDLGVIAEVADRVCVMYAGNVVETAPVRELYKHPLHPYTQGLLSSIPRMDEPDKKLESIPGSVPNLIYPPSGCRFHPRCPHAMPVCREKRPPMTIEGGGHTVACYLYNGPVAPG
ncbi:MAG TPA: ABC transporter ATP-binding protein, partial [Thermoplasmata archaeon]|nr:ABC transporter ATP-binding protein [Thermoplasmata archaeon]